MFNISVKRQNCHQYFFYITSLMANISLPTLTEIIFLVFHTFFFIFLFFFTPSFPISLSSFTYHYFSLSLFITQLLFQLDSILQLICSLFIYISHTLYSPSLSNFTPLYLSKYSYISVHLSQTFSISFSFFLSLHHSNILTRFYLTTFYI